MSDPLASPARLLSPWQRRLAAAAITCAAIACIGLFGLGLFKVLSDFIIHFGGVIWPLVIAAMLSLLLDPVCDFIQRRLRLSRRASIVLLYLLVVGVTAGIALLLIPVLWGQLTALVDQIPVLWQRLIDSVGVRFPEAAHWMRSGGFSTWMKDHAQDLMHAAGSGAPALAEATMQLKQFAAKAAGLAIIPIYLFYLLDLRRDFTADLEREARFIPAGLRQDMVFLIRQFTGILVSFFRGQILIGLILGVLMAAGFQLCGISYGLILGLMMGLGNIIPYLGTMLGLATVLPVAYLQEDGGTGTLGAALGVIVVVQMIDGYLVTPRIMGKSTGLHPMAIILSMFFWGVALDGLLGMVMAIPLTAFIVVFWRLLKERHLHEPS